MIAPEAAPLHAFAEPDRVRATADAQLPTMRPGECDSGSRGTSRPIVDRFYPVLVDDAILAASDFKIRLPVGEAGALIAEYDFAVELLVDRAPVPADQEKVDSAPRNAATPGNRDDFGGAILRTFRKSEREGGSAGAFHRICLMSM